MADDQLPENVSFRLNTKYPDQRLVAQYIHEKGQDSKGKKTAIVQAIYAYLNSISIYLDAANDKDRIIIEKLENMDDSLWSRWIRDMVYERLSGLDARTGEPLPERIKVIETERVVIQEKLRVVNAINPELPINTDSDDSNSDLTKQGHEKASKINW